MRVSGFTLRDPENLQFSRCALLVYRAHVSPDSQGSSLSRKVYGFLVDTVSRNEMHAPQSMTHIHFSRKPNPCDQTKEEAPGASLMLLSFTALCCPLWKQSPSVHPFASAICGSTLCV